MPAVALEHVTRGRRGSQINDEKMGENLGKGHQSQVELGQPSTLAWSTISTEHETENSIILGENRRKPLFAAHPPFLGFTSICRGPSRELGLKDARSRLPMPPLRPEPGQPPNLARGSAKGPEVKARAGFHWPLRCLRPSAQPPALWMRLTGEGSLLQNAAPLIKLQASS